MFEHFREQLYFYCSSNRQNEPSTSYPVHDDIPYCRNVVNNLYRGKNQAILHIWNIVSNLYCGKNHDILH